MKTVNDIPDWLHNLVVYYKGVWPNITSHYRLSEKQHGFSGCGSFDLSRATFENATRLITGEPDDADAPEWANWKVQGSDGTWWWTALMPSIGGNNKVPYWSLSGTFCKASKGEVLGDWRNTLKSVNCSIDRRPIDEYEQQGWDEHEGRMQKPDSHYRHQYKGIKLDPYRIAWIYRMQGGPREQIMKKCLRFTDKRQTEQQVVDEIRSALNRWQAMLDEDGEARS